MRVVVPHNTSRQEARQIVEQKLGSLMRQFGHHADNVEQEWIGETLHVRGRSHGINVKGFVEVTESEVVIDGDLPLIALPFESRIRQTVQREAEQMFRKA